ncbi:MAG: 1-aminocyclopropane-1-carboxylate deaminase/D-cysteine desulfhydrase [Flavobacteriales bacterium]
MMIFDSKTQGVKEVFYDSLTENNIRLLIQREDLNNRYCSGNKLWKLKYNLLEAKRLNKKSILTFGGAYSNHIVATAYACHYLGFQSLGIIRGEEKEQLNPSLKLAQRFGMQFQYIDRQSYRSKNYNDWQIKYPSSYVIPEGGANELAVKGCSEMINEINFDLVCVPVGTGGTLAGVVKAIKPNQTALGFSSLKNGQFNNEVVAQYVNSSNWSIECKYHFGGYAKINKELIDFINEFKKQFSVPLDPIYTGKMFYGIFDMIKQNKFEKNTTILAIHTGGLQAINGMNERIKSKGWKIEY